MCYQIVALFKEFLVIIMLTLVIANIILKLEAQRSTHLAIALVHITHVYFTVWSSNRLSDHRAIIDSSVTT